MITGKEPAFPEVLVPNGKGGTLDSYKGLTKREYFAAMAMQGFCQFFSDSYADQDARTYKTSARLAVKMADALITELNK